MDNEGNEQRSNEQEGKRYSATPNDERYVKIDTHISLFQILIIVLLIIIIGFLIYLNQKSGENIGKNNSNYFSYRDYEDDYDEEDDEDYYEEEQYNEKEYGDNVFNAVDEEYDEEDDEELQYDEKESGGIVFDVVKEDGFKDGFNYIDPEDFKMNIEPNIVLNGVYSNTNTFSYSVSNNNVGRNLEHAKLIVAFYDEANKLVGLDAANLDCILAQTTAYFCGTYGQAMPYARYDYRVVLRESASELVFDKDAIIYTLDEGRYNYFINVESTLRNNGVTSIFFAKYKDAAGNVIFVDNLDSYVSNYGNNDLGRATIYVEKELHDKDDKPVKYSTCEIEYYTSYLDK